MVLPGLWLDSLRQRGGLLGEQKTKMSVFPLLFDLGPAKPTTRDIAKAVKAGGTAALTEAERRADQARYQEITCRSALNRVRGMPFEWTLNPYAAARTAATTATRAATTPSSR
jgi:hypothetical protein